jgi:hypothetical protein
LDIFTKVARAHAKMMALIPANQKKMEIAIG